MGPASASGDPPASGLVVEPVSRSPASFVGSVGGLAGSMPSTFSRSEKPMMALQATVEADRAVVASHRSKRIFPSLALRLAGREPTRHEAVAESGASQEAPSARHRGPLPAPRHL